MTPRQIDLIRSSFAGVLGRSDAAGRFFYEELFRIAPELQPMFRSDIVWQGKKVIDTIGLAVYALRSPGGPAAALAALGGAHARRYGVRREHYEPVGRALIATLDHCLGERFTDETREAWTGFYAVMTEVMVSAGEDAPA